MESDIPMDAIRLPEILSDFEDYFNVKSSYDVYSLIKNSSCLPPTQEKIWKYSGSALFAGRPLNSAMIFVAGATGSGKSTVINSLFCDDIYNENAWKPETSKIVLLRNALKVTMENPNISAYFDFVETSGYFEFDKEADYQTQLRNFRDSRIELVKRTEIPWIFRQYFSIPENVYPNLVLFVVNATDSTIEQENSEFRKSLHLLKTSGNLLDTKNNNLIIVVTHLMSLDEDHQIVVEKFGEIERKIRQVVTETLGISQVDIIPIENQPTKCNLCKSGDYYQLPNGDLSHRNLYMAMKERLSKNNDLLGRLCMAWYSDVNCPDRENSAVKFYVHVPLHPSEAVQWRRKSLEKQPKKSKRKFFLRLRGKAKGSHSGLVEPSGTRVSGVSGILGVSQSKFTPKTSDLPKLHNVGYGFCPVSEHVKRSPYSFISSKDRNTVDIFKSKFDTPRVGVTAFKEDEAQSDVFTFLKKVQYEDKMRHTYALEVGLKLVVDASSEGRWVEDTHVSKHQHLICQNYEIKSATFKLDEYAYDLPKTDEFQRSLDSLPDCYSDETATKFRSFFSKWGTHLISEHGVGGSVHLSCIVNESKFTESNWSEFKNKIQGVLNRITGTGDGKAEIQAETNTIALRSVFVSKEHSGSTGGNPNLLRLGEEISPEKLQEWWNSVSATPSALKKSLKLYPYYHLIDGPKSESLREATEKYLQNALMAKVDAGRNEMVINDLNETIEEPASESNCFPKGTLVLVNDGKRNMSIENLASCRGQQLTTLHLTGGSSEKMKIGKFSSTKFCTFLDAKPEVEIEYIALSFTNGEKLLVSEDHMIFQYIPEKQVVIGKQAKYFKIGEMAVYTDFPGESFIQYPVVTQITKEKHLGAYCPLTMSGSFFAQGFLVSSYANVNSFKLAQCAMAPLKMWHMTPSFKIYSKGRSNYDEVIQRNCGGGGIHPYAKIMIALRKSFTRHENENK